MECRKALDSFGYGDVHAVVDLHKGQGAQPFLPHGRAHVVAKSAEDPAASFAFTACHGKSAGDSDEDMNVGEAVYRASYRPTCRKTYVTQSRPYIVTVVTTRARAECT